MATKKANSKKMHSGFEAPTIGTIYPKGTTFKKNPNGTVTPIFPKTAKSKGKK